MKPLAQERSPAADSKDTRAHRVEAVVVSSDDALLIELGPILGNRYRTHSVDTPAEIAATVHAARWLGIVDVGSLPDARGAVARLELQYHRCPLIIVASNPEEWAAALARGAIAAAVARHELAGPRLLEALAAAEARLHAESPAEALPAAGHEAGRSTSGIASARKLGWIALAAVLLVALATGGWWLSHRSGGAATVVNTAAAAAQSALPAAVTAQSPAAPRPQTVLELLSAARVAFGDQKLLLPRPDGEPRGDSALELYTQVLKQQPDNDEALDGVKRLFAIGKARIQADLASGKLDDATRLVNLFQGAGVSRSELQGISASISAARPKWTAARAQQNIAAGNLPAADQLLAQLAAAGTNPASVAQLRRALDAKKVDLQLAGMAAQVKAAIAAGALLDPANDNARTRLAAMRAASRTNPQTLAAQRALQAALLDRGQQATRGGQFDQAQRYLSAAADLGSSSEVGADRRQLQEAIEAANQRTAAASAAAQARAASAAASASAEGRTVSTPAPAPPKPVTPSYVAARPRGGLGVSYPPGLSVAGYVIVEFTLEPDGTASDAKVVQASPRGLFDQVALRAVSGGRYDTRDLAGRVPPVRARILLRFKPN
ncbi:MAG: TonB family protein [Steroidobacteraceae bacterium]